MVQENRFKPVRFGSRLKPAVYLRKFLKPAVWLIVEPAVNRLTVVETAVNRLNRPNIPKLVGLVPPSRKGGWFGLLLFELVNHFSVPWVRKWVRKWGPWVVC